MSSSSQGKGLAIVAALLLALGLYTNSWWTMEGFGLEVDIGLFEAEGCFQGECESMSYSKALKQGSDLSFTDGVKLRGAQWGGIAALFLLVAFALFGSGLAGMAAALYVPSAIVASLCGYLFYRIFSTSEVGALGEMGYSFMIFQAGLWLGLAAIVSAARSRS